jgi:hypothetical protein
VTIEVQPVGIERIEERLGLFEKMYEMPSTQFVDAFRNGRLKETPDFHEWARLVAIVDFFHRSEG